MPEVNQEGPIIVKSAIPKNRQELLKWNGWGYNDSGFCLKPEVKSIYLKGTRYPIGGVILPNFYGWAEEVLNFSETRPQKKLQDIPTEDQYPKPNITTDALYKISSLGVPYSLKVIDRVIRGHGHTLHEIYALQNSKLDRIPDMVVWPACHDDVVKIVELANEENLVLIPFGGGTAVSGAVECPVDEPRPIISLDTSQMNRILWIDRENLVACCESGIVGQDLERELGKLGFTTGHEPDSYEFSSLGGWVATRASGMKKNVYGNIEDLLVQVRMVTAKGVLQKNCQVPRMSCGPDFNHIVLGSEGSLGVITEVVIKIRPLPKFRKYGSIVFPSFELGVQYMQEVARRKWQPASIRLLDNGQFKFGLILKPKSTGFDSIIEGIKKFYVTKIKGFNPDEMCVMTLLFEGEESEVKINEKKLYDLAKQFGGISAGEQNGERGYMLTFVIAYIRDFGLLYNIMSESFETSAPWDRAVTLVKNVKQVIADECRTIGITHSMINCRVTQTYDAGCVIYFYLAYTHENIEGDPLSIYRRLEVKARDEIIANGGSISHHHGVGKCRKQWYPRTVSDVGVGLFLAAKKELDPKNVFATNNLVQSKL